MKIVIDIPDFIYNALKEDVDCGTVNLNHAIVNGIVLPKGHGDLVDRDKLKPLMSEYFIDTSRLHYENLTNAEHINLGIENCLNELDEMEPVIKADKEVG